MIDYKAINKAAWNIRTEKHLGSAFYDVKGWMQHFNSLNEPELALLPEVKGKKLLHLQCHFGQDTLSLAHLGAEVTGVDISDQAIKRAQELSEKSGLPGRFICSDIYELPNVLHDQFDIVFTSYGTIGWLPDMEKWGEVVGHFLKPGGEFLIVEFHPAVWMFDEAFQFIKYSYFKEEPIVETQGTYTEGEPQTEETMVTWNHSLASVVNALLQNGLEILRFEEYDYSCYDCFGGATEKAGKGWRIKGMGSNLPMMYALHARKKA